MRKIISVVVIVLLAALLVSPAFAAKKKDKPGWEGWDRWNIDVGAFLSQQSTNIRLDATDGSFGTQINFEDNLGLDSRQTDPRIDVLWRYKKRSSLSLSYFKLDRDAVAPLTVTLRFGDIVLDPVVSPAVRTVYNIEVISAQWGYSFFRTPKWDARFTIGIYAMDIFAAIQDPAAAQTDQGDVLAPLPVFGMGFDRKLTGKWHLQGKFNYFQIEAENEYKGSLVDFLVAATHHTFKNVGFGVGFNSTQLDIDSTDKDFSGALDIKYRGPFLYARVRLRPGG
ncbi:MAG: hypothetical protein ACE5K1_09170 [Acidiferrobacterales bacterium]